MLVWYKLDFLSDQNQEKFQKKWREATGNQKAQKQRNLFSLWKFHKVKNHLVEKGSPCEKISQPKEPSCENEVVLRK